MHPADTLKVRSLVDALYAAVRERILNGEVAAGESLTEVALSTRYSVARPTAKAAMERLVYDGLLQRATNKTARVPILGTDDVTDLYRIRSVLEREVMVTLAGRGEVPEDARRSHHELRGLSEGPNVTEIVRSDIAFHRALVAAVGSPRLSRAHNSLIAEAHLCMAQVQANRLLNPSRIVQEHEEILEAIESGNKHRSAKEITDHLSRACDRLLSHLEASGADPAAGR